MNNFQVAENTPLTHSKNAFQVFVVVNIDHDNLIEGVYPSPARAVQYIKEWLTDSEYATDVDCQPGEDDLIGDCHIVYIKGVPSYRIEPQELKF